MLIRSIETEHRSIALVESTVVGLSAIRHHVDKNSVPSSLDTLVPDFLLAVPIDPFTGVPLSFRRIPRGFVVYSIGPDGNDDRGDPAPEDVSLMDDGDISFRVVALN